MARWLRFITPRVILFAVLGMLSSASWQPPWHALAVNPPNLSSSSLSSSLHLSPHVASSLGLGDEGKGDGVVELGRGLAEVVSRAMGLESGDGTTVVAICFFVFLLCVCMILGHLLEEVHWLSESVTAIIFGLLAGAVVLQFTSGSTSHILRFDENLFFIYLLPPIIFNAGFQVKKKSFFRNFGGIMLYGVLGVFISVAVIAAGCSLLFPLLGLNHSLKVYLIVGVIFSATDSVCTLQVLDQEEQPLLYSLVFGEGVVNDATSVVLFFATSKLKQTTASLELSDFLYIIGQFLYLFGSSTLLGVFLGLLSAFLIKTLYFGRHSTDREIALMVLMAYQSYVTAEVLQQHKNLFG